MIKTETSFLLLIHFVNSFCLKSEQTCFETDPFDPYKNIVFFELFFNPIWQSEKNDVEDPCVNGTGGIIFHELEFSTFCETNFEKMRLLLTGSSSTLTHDQIIKKRQKELDDFNFQNPNYFTNLKQSKGLSKSKSQLQKWRKDQEKQLKEKLFINFDGIEIIGFIDFVKVSEKGNPLLR